MVLSMVPCLMCKGDEASILIGYVLLALTEGGSAASLMPLLAIDVV